MSLTPVVYTRLRFRLRVAWSLSRDRLLFEQTHIRVVSETAVASLASHLANHAQRDEPLDNLIRRVLQALKHDVATVGTITVPPQGSERQGVRRVIREVESTLETEGGIRRILQPR